MKRLLLVTVIFLSVKSFGQSDSTKWLRAFPITDYMVDLNDSVKLVQVELPEGMWLKEKQLGLLRGVYNDAQSDTVQKGYGRCQLIKGNFYYFAIGHNTSGKPPEQGDLLYVFMDKTPVYYGLIPKLAAHFTALMSVYENPYFDRYLVYDNWTKEKERSVIDSMVSDIRFTGNYFLQNDPSMDKLISSGSFKGKMVLSVMIACQPSQLKDFINYMIARPRLYAGKKWKIAEVFATWAMEGAPTVLTD